MNYKQSLKYKSSNQQFQSNKMDNLRNKFRNEKRQSATPQEKTVRMSARKNDEKKRVIKKVTHYSNEITQAWNCRSNEPKQILCFYLKKMEYSRLTYAFSHLKFLYFLQWEQQNHSQQNHSGENQIQIQTNYQTNYQKCQKYQSCIPLTKCLFKLTSKLLHAAIHHIKLSSKYYEWALEEEPFSDQSSENSQKIQSYLRGLELNKVKEDVVMTLDSVLTKNTQKKLMQSFINIKQIYQTSLRLQAYRDGQSLAILQTILERINEARNQQHLYQAFQNIYNQSQYKQHLEEQNRRNAAKLSSQAKCQNKPPRQPLNENKSTVTRHHEKNYLNSKESTRTRKEHVPQVQVKAYNGSEDEQIDYEQKVMNNLPTKRTHKSNRMKESHLEEYYDNTSSQVVEKYFPTISQQREDNRLHSYYGQQKNQSYNSAFYTPPLNSQNCIPLTNVRDKKENKFYESRGNNNNYQNTYQYHTREENYYEAYHETAQESCQSSENKEVIQQIYVIRNHATKPRRKPDKLVKVPVMSLNVHVVIIPTQSKRETQKKKAQYFQKQYNYQQEEVNTCQNCQYCLKIAKSRKQVQKMMAKRGRTSNSVTKKQVNNFTSQEKSSHQKESISQIQELSRKEFQNQQYRISLNSAEKETQQNQQTTSQFRSQQNKNAFNFNKNNKKEGKIQQTHQKNQKTRFFRRPNV